MGRRTRSESTAYLAPTLRLLVGSHLETPLQLDPRLSADTSAGHTAEEVAAAAFADCPDHSGRSERSVSDLSIKRPIARTHPETGRDMNRDGVPRKFHLD